MLASKRQIRKNKKKKKQAGPSSKGNRVPKKGRAVPFTAPLDSYSTHVQLGESTRDFARLQANPPSGPLVGGTDFPALMSGKERAFAKGSFPLPATGFGYVAMDPHWASLSGAGILSVFTVSPTYAGATVQLDNAGGAAGGLGYQTNSTYDASLVGPNPDQAQYRPVAAQLRLRWNGTELNRGGTVIGVQNPKHLSLQGSNFSMIEAFEDSVKFSGKQIQDWMKINWKQLDTDDTQFRRDLPANTPAAGDSSFYMGFVIQCPPNTPGSFEWEAYAASEFDGTRVRNKTATVFDPVGWAAVHTASVHNKMLRRPHQLSDDQAELVGVQAVAQAAGASTHVTHRKKESGDSSGAVGGTVGTGLAVAAAVGGLLSWLL